MRDLNVRDGGRKSSFSRRHWRGLWVLEPAANLDLANIRMIEGLVRDHNTRRGTTVVRVTHNVFHARPLTTCTGLVLDGELVDLDPTEALFTAPKDPRIAAFTSGKFVY